MVKSLLPWAVDGSQASHAFQSVCLSSPALFREQAVGVAEVWRRGGL